MWHDEWCIIMILNDMGPGCLGECMMAWQHELRNVCIVIAPPVMRWQQHT